ncbi:hypothetical protein CRG98_015000 [Punica granatum]|uniref:Glabrous enhancer-binding protein-like DBD domain-containing protein n=1 Tax=Punica granatum TaxID=22663 RepID=A0A2I0K7P6_PUNGR|nr:hypothetical protein CRG98_015000 [Punica granatum]
MSTPLTPTTARLRPASRRRSGPYSPPTPWADNNHHGEHHDRAPPSADGNRRPRFERIFMEEDEIALLKSLWHNSISSPAAKIDPATFEILGRSLGSRFTHNQLSNKLRHMRAKYHKQSLTKSYIKTPHDRETYELCRKIWGENKAEPMEEREEVPSQEEVQSQRQSQSCGRNKHMNAAAVEEKGNEEDGVDLGKFPVLVEECEKALEGNGVWRSSCKKLVAFLVNESQFEAFDGYTKR